MSIPSIPSVMQEARIVDPTHFAVVPAPVPRLHSPDEILVRTAACGICSGDLMPWYLEKKVGTVLGHEVAGWAVEVGRQVEHIRPGDLVFMHHHAPCLNCEDCRRGQYVHCAFWRQSRLDPGGMAEWIRVPGVNVKNDSFAVNDLSVEQAVFIEPLGCSVKALGRVGRMVDLASNTFAVIVGCGVMGMLNLAAARALGVGKVTAVEPNSERRRLALNFGAAKALTPEEAERELRQAADFALVGPGQPEVIRQSLSYLRPGGVALIFTPTPTGVLAGLDLGDLYFREISLVPSYSCGPEDTRRAYELIRERRLQIDALVTHRFLLHDVQEAYETARQGGPALKVLVTFPRDTN